MTPREKKLAVIVAGILGLMALWSGWGKIDAAFTQRENQLDALRREARKRQQVVREGERAEARRAEYRRRSLPANRELAMFQYRSWLRQLIDSAGWSDVDLRPQQVPARRGVYERLAFSISGRGSLSSLVKFLHAFYQTDHLHQVRRLDLQPAAAGGGKLDIVLLVEALSLPDAVQKDSLKPVEKPARPLAPLASYETSIVGRNLFAPYVPPPPPKPPVKVEVVKETPKPPPPKPTFDEAKFAYLTAIVQNVSGELQAWVQVRTTGETLRLQVGDPIRLGSLSGKVVRIDAQQAIFAFGADYLLVTLGESVRDGLPVPAAGL